MAAFGSFTDSHEFIPLDFRSSKKSFFVKFLYDRQCSIFFVWFSMCTFMVVHTVQWESLMPSSIRFYDLVNRPFDSSLAMECQKSIPSLQIVHVLSLIAMIAMKTPLLKPLFSHLWQIWYPYRNNCHHCPLPPSAHLTLRNVVCRHKHNGIVTN